MAIVFPPTRTEPFFEEDPGIDTSQWRITVRWSNYLDQLGVAINEIDNVTTEIQDSGIETQIQQVQSFSAALSNQIEDVDQLATQVNQQSAMLKRQRQIIDEQAEIGIEIGRLNAQMAAISAQLSDIQQLIEVT